MSISPSPTFLRRTDPNLYCPRHSLQEVYQAATLAFPLLKEKTRTCNTTKSDNLSPVPIALQSLSKKRLSPLLPSIPRHSCTNTAHLPCFAIRILERIFTKEGLKLAPLDEESDRQVHNIVEDPNLFVQFINTRARIIERHIQRPMSLEEKKYILSGCQLNT